MAKSESAKRFLDCVGREDYEGALTAYAENEGLIGELASEEIDGSFTVLLNSDVFTDDRAQRFYDAVIRI